mmetsp:Transcript_8679/g.35403  ORF Transcript_8679/g.35403 Transcript_8679/m.35403 type:complete len:230 (-) Transcript_8679:2376-3065(-)
MCRARARGRTPEGGSSYTVWGGGRRREAEVGTRWWFILAVWRGGPVCRLGHFCLVSVSVVVLGGGGAESCDRLGKHAHKDARDDMPPERPCGNKMRATCCSCVAAALFSRGGVGGLGGTCVYARAPSEVRRHSPLPSVPASKYQRVASSSARSAAVDGDVQGSAVAPATGPDASAFASASSACFFSSAAFCAAAISSGDFFFFLPYTTFLGLSAAASTLAPACASSASR